MPFLDLPTHRLHYRIDGAEGAPWLTFCNSLGTDLTMWDLQVAELAKDFRILRYDRRGHGQSTAADGLYTVDQLGGDVVALWDALQIDRTHFCGLSIGGLTGQWLGLNAAERLDKLIVCATAAKIGTAESWAQRIAGVQESGMKPLAEGTVTRWFTEHFTDTHEEQVKDIIDVFLATTPEGYAGCCSAVAQADFRDALAKITVPLLAIAGDDDPVCPPADLQHIADSVADGRFVQVAGRHICNVESPAALTTALRDFLTA
ncbi:3-oxoadipate enol-lactonase [Pseudoxanthomonas sp. GM95]|uniref:3-oxoadipate enol-lactonase n=1 Tax=Pseudoxanthomonas sp. GM95 TaxID=1881043 RepID=UPI0008CF371D|nr:3-oxoadipate enol-lactonase [Pseudoxanthomonas sp. GM95]SEM44014.1 3-oxoadipate enol-lactonase [Pseudoxanthomonas sp. GM95]